MNICCIIVVSCLQELERSEDVNQLQLELNHIQAILEDKTKNLTRAEGIIEDLTQELSSTQEEASKALQRVNTCEQSLVTYEEQKQALQNEVSVTYALLILFNHRHNHTSLIFGS